MAWIPFRNTVNAGDILRSENTQQDNAAGSMVNFMSRTYAQHTGYTQQQYNNGSVRSVQLFSPAQGNSKLVNKLTPLPIDYSNNPRSE